MSARKKSKDKNNTFQHKIKIFFCGITVTIFSTWIIKSIIEDMSMYQFSSLFHYGEIIYFNSYQIITPLGIPILFFTIVTAGFAFFNKGKIPKKIDFTMNFITLILIMLIILTQFLCLLVTIWLGVFSPYKTCEPEGFRYYYVRDVGDCQRLMREEARKE
ncbi:hypothetical protein [Pseudocitrobacter faecalis]|uniref:hypothetical protein n=1 Tax=Pseudocitrobacter faecalis TaxID=1398493 RepID=UPI003B9FABB7